MPGAVLDCLKGEVTPVVKVSVTANKGPQLSEKSSRPFPKRARVTFSYDASSKSILLCQSTACSLTQLPESLSSGETGGLILSTRALYLA